MVVDDGFESAISREDAFEGRTPKSTTFPISSSTKGDNDVGDSIFLSALGSFVWLADRLHLPGKGAKKHRGARARLPPPNPILFQTWPRDGINPPQHEFPVAPNTTPDNPDEMVIAFDGEPSEPTRNTVRTHCASLSPSLREMLCGSQIDPTELKLACARNMEHTSCPSLWTGSTKDTESIAGYDVGRRPDSSDRTAKGVSLTDGTLPEVRIFAPEAEIDSLLTNLDAADVFKYLESPLRQPSSLSEKAKLVPGLVVFRIPNPPSRGAPK
ncbi:hypothetical protein MFIFM68171_08206 [Madurella fahalii]|uniref:Uncharacterized protein n=1 Tax=Madurella fahalii TaxID=1157608 RepID=A0ABQ0GJT6_9PEZI